MMRSVLRWILILACLLAVGPAVGRMAGALHDADGGHATTLLINDSTGAGLLAAAAAFAAAAAVGLAGAHFFSLGTGFTCAGLVLAWSRWGLGTVDGLVRRAGDGRDFTTIAAEGLVAALLAVALGVLMLRLADRRQPGEAPKGLVSLFVRPHGETNAWAAAALSLGAGLIGGGVAVWVIAASGLRGQTLMAAVVGGIAAGAAGQLTASSLRCTLTPPAPMLALALLALAGPLLARAMQGGRLAEATYAGELLALARPLSLDWAAGGLLGVPLGLAWAGAMLDHRGAEAA